MKKQTGSPAAETIRLQQIARILVDQIAAGRYDADSEEEDKPKRKPGRPSGRITHEMIQEANRQALADQGREVDALKLQTAAGLLKALGHLAGLRGKLSELLLGNNRPLTVTGLRSMGKKKPPEVIRDQILDVRGKLDELLGLAEEATLPPRLIIPEGKPSFTDYIAKRSKQFGTLTREKLAKLLASTSDNNGQVITWFDMAESLGQPEREITGNISLLKQEIDNHGLDLQTFRLRRKDSRGVYEFVPAYRLSWRDARHLNTMTSETLSISSQTALDRKSI